MLNPIKKVGILLLALTLGGLVFVVVSGDELPPLQPPQQSPQETPQEAPQPLQQPEQPNPQSTPSPPEPPAPPQNAPQPVLNPPAPPSEKNMAKDEIWHAYREFQEVNRILPNLKQTDEVVDLENMARQLYAKSEKLYENGRYRESRVYAHLTIETLHGIRDILNPNER